MTHLFSIVTQFFFILIQLVTFLYHYTWSKQLPDFLGFLGRNESTFDSSWVNFWFFKSQLLGLHVSTFLYSIFLHFLQLFLYLVFKQQWVNMCFFMSQLLVLHESTFGSLWVTFGSLFVIFGSSKVNFWFFMSQLLVLQKSTFVSSWINF